VVVHPVPDNCTVVGVPAEIVRRDGKRIGSTQRLDHGNLPDPVHELKQRMNYLQKEIEYLERKLQRSNSQHRQHQPNRPAEEAPPAPPPAEPVVEPPQ
jgi:serine O-acetyltransferase